MGLGKDPKENKRSVTTAKRLNGMSFAKAEAERIDQEQRHKTAYNYLTAVRSLTQFIGNDKWSFADITTSMLERYQRWLCNRGIRLNTVSVYMRTLRALYNRAVKIMPTVRSQLCSRGTNRQPNEASPNQRYANCLHYGSTANRILPWLATFSCSALWLWECRL